jgi:MscS family membrane protein
LASDWGILKPDTGIDRFIEAGITLIVIVMVVRLVNPVLILVSETSLRRLGKAEQLAVLRRLEPLIRALIWALGILVFLQSQGVQMGAIYASMAGAGIGVGLALKGPITNFINYFTILLDEPFKIGHFIRFDDVLSTVEKVGIRSTAIRSLSSEKVVISNEDLLNKTIQNYGDFPKRRVSHVIGVLYQTPVETVRKIPLLIQGTSKNCNFGSLYKRQ